MKKRYHTKIKKTPREIPTSPESHNRHVWIRQIPYLVFSIVTTWERNQIAVCVYNTPDVI